MISRRTLLTLAGAALAACAAPFRAAAAALADEATKALGKSQTIYITPLKKGGAESSCHSEVWFVYENGAIYVVTSSKAWRARAVGLGLNQARMWVGEFGVWKRATEAFRKAPQLSATAALDRRFRREGAGARGVRQEVPARVDRLGTEIQERPRRRFARHAALHAHRISRPPCRSTSSE